MEEGNLPIEIAREPEEQAHLSQGNDTDSPAMELIKKQRKGITFAEATQSSEHSASQNSSTYKDVLSQPAPGLTHRQRLLWLQKRRSSGLWVQCDDCSRWRFLPNALDSYQLPAKWRCSMNSDKTAADCSVPEVPLRLREEEDLIHGEYSAGSIVWARLAGWPWWPAMVDDCPDTEQYYWLDGFSDIPTHYNVVFFDAFDATRAWIAPDQLKPFAANRKVLGKLPKDKRYRKRMEVAITQAEDADGLPLPQRLAKYSFIARYPGAINHPKKISKKELKRFQNKLKRKYNIEFPNETDTSEDESDESYQREETTTVIKKGKNMMIIGTPKKPKEKKSRAKTDKRIKGVNKRIQDSLFETDSQHIANENNNSIENSLLKTDLHSEITENSIPQETVQESVNEIFKQPNSMAVQVGSTITSTVFDSAPDNDTSATYVPPVVRSEIPSSDGDTEILNETSKIRAASPSSDDFDF